MQASSCVNAPDFVKSIIYYWSEPKPGDVFYRRDFIRKNIACFKVTPRVSYLDVSFADACAER